MKKVVLNSGRSVSAWADAPIRVGLFAVVMCLCASVSAEALPKAAGIWLSRHAQHRLSAENKEQLEQNLRTIMGLPELRFGEEGQLLLGDLSAAEGGSEIARQMLLCALGSGHIFIIEDHCNSPSVNFGQMDEGTNYEDTIVGCQFLIWRIRLDFDDFRTINAPADVQESFNPGITLLHELLHGLGYRDAKQPEEIGECESLVNQVRAELRLPLRDQYFADTLRITPNVFTLRLKFSGATRRRAKYLFFVLSPGADLADFSEKVIGTRRKTP